MKLDQQVCSLEQAKRLKELGVNAPSLWSRFKTASHSGYVLSEMKVRHTWILTGNAYEEEDIEFEPVWTVAEVSQMLPRYYPSWRFLEEGGKEEFWIATVIGQPEGYERKKDDVCDIRTVAAFDRYGTTQAEALAALLISLLETGTETAEEVNKRLEA